MSKAGTSAPPSINPFQLAATQAEGNVATAAAQAGLNNVSTASPFGTSTFTPYGTGPNGIGPAGYTLNQNLNPAIQGVFNNQTSLAQLLTGAASNLSPLSYNLAGPGSNLATGAVEGLQGILPWTYGPAESASNLIGSSISAANAAPTSISFSGLNPLNPGSASELVGTPGAAGNTPIGQAENAAYNAQAGFLDPQFSEKQSDIDQQLADEGIGPGTAAYSRAQGDLGRQETLAYQQAQDAAVGAGEQEQEQLFGQNLATRQQRVGETEAQAAFPLAAAEGLGSLAESILGGAIGDTSQILGAGENVVGNAEQGIGSLYPLADFSATGSVPTTVGNTNVAAPNVVQAGQVGATNAFNQFAAGTAINNQIGGAIGSLGGALGLGNGGLASLFGLGSPSTWLGSAFA